MNGRTRFLETMRFGHPDRVPYFEDGIRKEVLKVWRKQGLANDADLARMFTTDQREEIDLNVDPHPWPKRWPSTRAELKTYAASLNPDDRSRLPGNWKKKGRKSNRN